ncbi:putative GPI-anchored protein, partial [Cucurbita argyrosperma subsp. argyrosperma]
MEITSGLDGFFRIVNLVYEINKDPVVAKLLICVSFSFIQFSNRLGLLAKQPASVCIPGTADDDLHRGINSYRASLNLTALVENDNAECLAEKIADKFKNQPCTNTTGSNTISGTEPQFDDYPNLLAKCNLNISNTRDGTIMPACVPNRVPDLVLTNFTKSQYSGKLNDTKYTGIGIGTEDDWVVVVLTTSTADGSFVPASKNTATLKELWDPLISNASFKERQNVLGYSNGLVETL